MQAGNKKSIIQKALANLDKTQVVDGGLYKPYKVTSKYGSHTISLPEKYKIIILNDNFYLVTNRHSGISMFADGQRVSGMWNPNYSDLVAEDWVVIEKGPYAGPLPPVIKENQQGMVFEFYKIKMKEEHIKIIIISVIVSILITLINIDLLGK